LVRKPEGKIPLGRPGHRWKHDVKMDLKEIEWEVVNNRIHVALADRRKQISRFHKR
jgi:hypothetical protein